MRRMLSRLFQNKDHGWKEIGETFIRYRVFSCRWFNIYIHQMSAPVPHEQCHDHPWHFWTLILFGGYDEVTDSGTVYRGAGSLLYRTAEFTHNTITRKGMTHWSVILTSHKKRKWGFRTCG